MVRAVALAVAVLIACGASPKKDSRAEFLGETIPKQCRHDEETEECVGFWLDGILKLLGQRTYDDPAIARYVATVGDRLARAAGDRRPWKFRLLDDPDAQAFVISGSTVYINRGTLAILRSEAELAAVLAHEMGHLRGGHSKEKWEEFGRQRSQVEQSMQHKYERDDEIQADETAVLLLGRAGYDPRAVETMLRALAGTTRYEAEENPEAVHPWWPERIARAQAAITERSGGELAEARYRTNVASLIIGLDPRRISLLDQTVIFATTNAALDLPPFESSKLGDGTLDLTFADGSKARLMTVNADLARLMAAQAEDDKRVLEVHHGSGRDAITIAVTGTANAQAMAKSLREAMREPRPAELARLTPTHVDLAAPRRLWSH